MVFANGRGAKQVHRTAEQLEELRSAAWGKLSNPPPMFASFPETPLVGQRLVARLLRNNPEEFQAYAAMWREAAPELWGSESQLMDWRNYPKLFGTGALFMKSGVCGIAFEDKAEGSLFGGAILILHMGARAIEGAHLGLLPSHRRLSSAMKFLVRLFPRLDTYVLASGAEYAYCFVPAEERWVQGLLERTGFSPRGALPGFMLRYAGQGYYLRDTAIFYDKLYGPRACRFARPALLTSRARRIWEVVRTGEETEEPEE